MNILSGLVVVPLGSTAAHVPSHVKYLEDDMSMEQRSDGRTAVGNGISFFFKILKASPSSSDLNLNLQPKNGTM